jgi:Tol biopolymer transport system component/DNA-binding winged helix-turn-helix (wHTH) protein
MAQPSRNPQSVRFGLFELDLNARELRKSGMRIKLQEQPFQILALLLERPGGIVTREELQKKLWPGDTFVDFDLSLNSAVKKLRQALNDDSENPRFVETLYRRGYRFIAPVNGASDSDQIRLVDSESAAAAPASSIPIPAVSRPSTRRGRVVFYRVIPVLLVLLVGIGVYWRVPAAQLTVLGYTQITHDGLSKGSIVSDGQRLYFGELQADHFVVSQVSVAGGETGVLPTPFGNDSVLDVAPNGSALLLGVFRGTDKGGELWSLPLPSGAPRRVGDSIIESAAWSPDGRQLFFSKGRDVYVAKSDGSDSRKLAAMVGPAYDFSFSPDGRRLRFDVVDTRNGGAAIWEMNRDGTGSHPLLPGWNEDLRDCCGRWTPDGRYFLFQSFRDGREGIWALADKSPWLGRKAKPVQLTNGPLFFGSALPSKDGKRIFAVGSQPRCELMHYDNKSGFTPFLDGISASDVAFSADGKWVTYVSVPDRQLWRSRVDGSERVQFTFEGMLAGLPKWSPDGKQIVFMGSTWKTGWRAYLVSSDGTGLRELVPGADIGYDPGWSPDGKSIVLTLNSAGSGIPVEGPGIAIVDVETRKVSPLPGAKLLFSPRWSPDGRHIAAITIDSGKLLQFDRVTQKWEDLVSMPMGYPTWSHDGQYIYFDTTLTDDPAFFRLRISDRKLERLVGLKGMRRYWGEFGPWTGLAPDDSPLLIRDTSSQEIYALDWKVP